METSHVDMDMETFNLRCLVFCMLTLFVCVERAVGRSISIFAVVAIVAASVSFFCCLYLMLIHSMLRAVLGSVSVLVFLLVLLLLFAALSPLAACGVALAAAMGSQVAVAPGVAHRNYNVYAVMENVLYIGGSCPWLVVQGRS